MTYKEKYIKYKNKYLSLKNQIGSSYRDYSNSSRSHVVVNFDFLPSQINTPSYQSNENDLYDDSPVQTSLLREDDSQPVQRSLFREADGDDLFECIAKFDKFIGDQIIKKEFTPIQYHQRPLYKFKIFDNNGILNCKSLLVQTLLDIYKGYILKTDLINHNFSLRFNDEAGIDAGGLKREYLRLLANEVSVIFDKDIAGKLYVNQTNIDITNENFLSILQTLYNSKVNIVSNFKIGHIFKYYLIDSSNILEEINTNGFESSFYNLLLNFIYLNYNDKKSFDSIDKVKEILKNKNNVNVLLYIFTLYIDKDSHISNYIDLIDDLLLYDDQESLTLWKDYSIDENIKKLLALFPKNGITNLFKIYSHLYYNETIDIEYLINKIQFIGISEELKTKFISIFRDYRQALTNELNNEESQRLKGIFGDQQQFLEKLLAYWTGLSLVTNRNYEIIYNQNILDLFHSHTCYYQLETKVPTDISLYDLVTSLLTRIEVSTGFSTAG